jgi:hypothetical protein
MLRPLVDAETEQRLVEDLAAVARADGGVLGRGVEADDDQVELLLSWGP